MDTKKIINTIQNSKDFILKNILNRFLKIIDINDLKDDKNDNQTVKHPEWFLYPINENETTYRIQEYDEKGNLIDIIDKYKNKRSIELLDIKIKDIVAKTILSANIEVFNEAGIEYVSFQANIIEIDGNAIYRLHNLRKENNECLVDCDYIKINTKILHIKIYEYQNNNWRLDVLDGCIADIAYADVIYLTTNGETPASSIVSTISYENKGTTKMNFILVCKAVMIATQGLDEQVYVIANNDTENGVDKTATTCTISIPY